MGWGYGPGLPPILLVLAANFIIQLDLVPTGTGSGAAAPTWISAPVAHHSTASVSVIMQDESVEENDWSRGLLFSQFHELRLTKSHCACMWVILRTITDS